MTAPVANRTFGRTRPALAALSSLLALQHAVPAAHAGCASDCDATYYLCLRGGASVGERGCSTARSICAMRCRPDFRAIALSPATSAYGFSGNHGSQQAAESEAIARCRAHAGRDDCKVQVWFKNGWCGALALGANGAYGTAPAASARAAQRAALAHCNRHSATPCTIQASLCAR